MSSLIPIRRFIYSASLTLTVRLVSFHRNNGWKRHCSAFIKRGIKWMNPMPTTDLVQTSLKKKSLAFFWIRLLAQAIHLLLLLFSWFIKTDRLGIGQDRFPRFIWILCWFVVLPKYNPTKGAEHRWTQLMRGKSQPFLFGLVLLQRFAKWSLVISRLLFYPGRG